MRNFEGGGDLDENGCFIKGKRAKLLSKTDHWSLLMKSFDDFSCTAGREDGSTEARKHGRTGGREDGSTGGREDGSTGGRAERQTKTTVDMETR